MALFLPPAFRGQEGARGGKGAGGRAPTSAEHARLGRFPQIAFLWHCICACGIDSRHRASTVGIYSRHRAPTLGIDSRPANNRFLRAGKALSSPKCFRIFQIVRIVKADDACQNIVGISTAAESTAVFSVVFGEKFQRNPLHIEKSVRK